MRLRRLLCLTAAVASLAGAIKAQTVTPLTVKDGSGASQPLCEYKPDGANLAGCTIRWAWNGAWVLEPGPCTQVVAINQTASTDVYASSAKVHVCAITLFTATAQAVSVVEGTGTTCAAGTAALIGGATADATHGLQFFAGQGVSQTSGVPFMQSKTTGDHLCILQSSNGVVSGFISFSDY